MDDTRAPVSRRRFVGIASAIGALPVVGALPRLPPQRPPAQEAAGEAFPNGINATSYVGAMAPTRSTLTKVSASG